MKKRWKGTSFTPFDKRKGFRKLFASGFKVFHRFFKKLRGVFLSRVVKLMGKIAHFGGVLPVVIRHIIQQSAYLCQIRRRAVVMIAVPVGMVVSAIAVIVVVVRVIVSFV